MPAMSRHVGWPVYMYMRFAECKYLIELLRTTLATVEAAEHCLWNAFFVTFIVALTEAAIFLSSRPLHASNLLLRNSGWWRLFIIVRHLKKQFWFWWESLRKITSVMVLL